MSNYAKRLTICNLSNTVCDLCVFIGSDVLDFNSGGLKASKELVVFP
jgi:hypothetical protein